MDSESLEMEHEGGTLVLAHVDLFSARRSDLPVLHSCSLWACVWGQLSQDLQCLQVAVMSVTYGRFGVFRIWVSVSHPAAAAKL